MRPTKYNNEMQAKADEYLSTYKELGSVIPSVAGLSIFLGVSKATIYNWGKEHDEFLDTLRVINSTQESELLNQGLVGSFNATITKLALANHGYSDKVETVNETKMEVQGRVTLDDFYGSDT